MLRKLVSGPLLVTALVACGDSTGPEDFSPVTTEQKTDAIMAAFNDNPALLSLGALESLSFGPLVQATLPRTPADLASPRTAARLRAFAGTVPSFSSVSPTMAIFPANLLGATFVWDTQQNRYVEDPQATGAPANGVRVILYAVDPILRRPLTPLDPVGYLDVMDESTPAADALHLVAVVNDITYLDYVASATTTQTSITLSAEGFISDGTNQVDFDLSLTLTSSAITVDYALSHDQGTIRLTGSLSEGEGDLTADVTLTINDGDNEIVFDITITPSTVTGSITYNGDVAVEIGGTPEEPTFTRPDGTPLTDAEIESLRHLGDLIDVIFNHFDDLLAPALVAFALG
jgi:hypothetical protein